MLNLQWQLTIAASAAAVVLGLGWYAYHEHVDADRARHEAQAVKAVSHANEAGLREANSDAPQREIRYVQVVRNVAAAGPVSAECARDPALLAAGAGVVSMRRAYCADHPERCTAPGVVPRAGDRSAGSGRPGA